MDPTRRLFLLGGLLFMTGCGSRQRTDLRPPTPWGAPPPTGDPGRSSGSTLASRSRPASPTWDSSGHGPNTSAGGAASDWGTSSGGGYADSLGVLDAGVLSRRSWATGEPIPSRMDRMLPVQRVTVHHDGIESLFYGTGQQETAARIDAIRRSHQAKSWGDIGYHFVVDRAGRVWEGRPLVWQGAHVKDRNEHNIGVLCLGNFDRQQPTDAQLSALEQHLNRLKSRFRLPAQNIHTHQELAATACPGFNLQRFMVSARTRGSLRV